MVLQYSGGSARLSSLLPKPDNECPERMRTHEALFGIEMRKKQSCAEG